jgi:hypothetical protein
VVSDIEFTESGPFHVVVTTSGEPSTSALEAGRRRVLTDPRFRRGMNVLYDHSRLESSDVPTAEIRSLAASAERDRAASGIGFFAIVAPTALMFGLTRMFEALAGEEFEAQGMIVRSRTEAFEWINRVG